MWYPWASDFDRLFSFSDLFRALDRARPGGQPGHIDPAEPPTTLIETGDGYELRVEVPGVTQQELTLDVHDQTVTLSARRELKKREGYATHRAERTSFAWKRAFNFPAKLDAERSVAKLEHGVLTVRVAKAPENQPRRVSIAVS